MGLVATPRESSKQDMPINLFPCVLGVNQFVCATPEVAFFYLTMGALEYEDIYIYI